MSEIPQDLLYTEDHEYLKSAGEPDVVYIGITDFAQGELGDIVFIELPKVGEDDVAEFALGEIGDADVDDVRLASRLEVFMVLRIQQVLRNF